MRTLNNLLLILISATSLLSTPAPAMEQDKELPALVAQIVQAYGGPEAIERIGAVNAEGEITATMRGDHGTYKRWLQRSRLLRVEIGYQRGTEIRILNGDHVWHGNGGGALQTVSGPGFLAVVYQYKQLDLPYGLLKGSYSLHYVDKENVDGMAIEVFEARDTEGPPMRINVDIASHHIVRVSGSIKLGAATTDLAAEFSDYRSVEGVAMPYRIRNFVGGMVVSDTVIQRYSVPAAEDNSLFSPSSSKCEAPQIALLRKN